MQSINQLLQKGLNTTMDSDMKVVGEYVCECCGNKVQIIRMKMLLGPDKGKYFETQKGCDCEVLGIIKAQQEEAKKARLAKIFEENSLINPALQKATFENFEPGEFKEAYDKAKQYVEEFDINKPKNLLFTGSFGTGKSHLSVSIAKALTQKGYTAIFISTPKLLTKIRNTYNQQSELTEEDILRALREADLVVFDDIGAEGEITGWGMQKIFEVIDSRAGKHNIFTTNLTSNELSASKDLQRIFSRMMMNAEPVIMNGTDYRRKQFLKGVKERDQ